MSNVLVNICMVTFNQEAFIAQAIEGILLQKTDFPFRLIIYDDASTDRTGDICKKYADQYPQKMSFVRNEKNLGPALNFCQAIKKTAGSSYIALCEGDDYWTDPQKLQKQISFLQENQDFNICFHGIEILLPDGRQVKDFMTKVPRGETTIHDLIDRGNFIHTPSVVLRNNFFLPDWYLNCPVGDYALYLLVAKEGKIKYFDNSMAIYRYGVGKHSSVCRSKRRVAFYKAYMELTKNYPDEKIREELIRKQNRFYYIFLYYFFLAREGNWSDLKLMTSMFMTSKISYIRRKYLKHAPS